MYSTLHTLALVFYAIMFCVDGCLLVSMFLEYRKGQWTKSFSRIMQLWFALGIGMVLGGLVGLLIPFLS